MHGRMPLGRGSPPLQPCDFSPSGVLVRPVRFPPKIYLSIDLSGKFPLEMDDDDGGGVGLCGGGDDALPERAARHREPPSCGKCGAARAAARIRMQSLCRACVAASVRQKIGRSLVALPDREAHLLVAASGGAASRLLQRAVFESLDTGRRRRHLSSAGSVHVDVSAALPYFSGAPELASFDAARRLCVRASVQLGLPVTIVLLESVFADDCGLVNDRVPADAPCTGAAGEAGKSPIFAVTVAGARICAPSAARALLEAPPIDEAALAAALLDAETLLSALRATAACELARRRLTSFFSAARTLDARCRIFDALLETALLRSAAALGYTCVATGQTVDRTAAALLARTCEGGGYAASLFAEPACVRMGDSASVSHANIVRSRESVASAAAPPLKELCVSAVTADSPPDQSRGFYWYADGALGSGAPSAPPAPRLHQRVRAPTRIRPLHECETKEIVLCCRYSGLEYVSTRSMSSAAPSLPRASISQCAADLLASLQNAFPNTVHNVVRTVRKLPPPPPPPLAPAALFSEGAAARPLCGSVGAVCALCGDVLPDPGSVQARHADEAAARMAPHLLGAQLSDPAEPLTLIRTDNPAGPAAAAAAASCGGLSTLSTAAEAAKDALLRRAFCHPCSLALREMDGAGAGRHPLGRAALAGAPAATAPATATVAAPGIRAALRRLVDSAPTHTVATLACLCADNAAAVSEQSCVSRAQLESFSLAMDAPAVSGEALSLEAAARSNRVRMRALISEFLLDTAEEIDEKRAGDL